MKLHRRHPQANSPMTLPEPAKERGAAWLRNAMLALGALAAGAAVVSWTAQYRLVFAIKHLSLIAALEAAIPDASAFIFASLGIALALNGRRAVRPRVLNIAAVGVSIFMNAIAASRGCSRAWPTRSTAQPQFWGSRWRAGGLIRRS